MNNNQLYFIEKKKQQKNSKLSPKYPPYLFLSLIINFADIKSNYPLSGPYM